MRNGTDLSEIEPRRLQTSSVILFADSSTLTANLSISSRSLMSKLNGNTLTSNLLTNFARSDPASSVNSSRTMARSFPKSRIQLKSAGRAIPSKLLETRHSAASVPRSPVSWRTIDGNMSSGSDILQREFVEIAGSKERKSKLLFSCGAKR